MKHKLTPFVAGLILSCALTGTIPLAVAAPEGGAAATDGIAASPAGPELNADTLFLILLGEIAGGRGDLAMSVEAYLHAARQTRDATVAKRATEISLIARDMDAAAKAARLWLEADPGSEDARRMLASILATRGDQMNEVQIELARILANSEGDRLEQNLLGLNRALSPMPDKNVVREIVYRLTEPYHHLAPAHLAMAEAAANDDDAVAALAAVDEALKRRPDWEAAIVLKSQLQVQLNAAGDALLLLRDYLSRHPQSRNAGLAYARTLVSAQDFPAALAQFRRLLERDPGNRDMMYAVALVAAQVGEVELARTEFENALRLGHPEGNAIRMNLGHLAERERKPSEALRWYREVTPSRQHVDAQMRIAHVLAAEGDLAAARLHLQTVEAQPEDQRRLMFAEVMLLREAKHYAEALRLMEAALYESPDDTDLLYETAMLAERVDKLDLMEQHLRTVIEIDPEHAHAHNALGYTFADRGIRLDEAEDLIARALEMSPDDPFILDSMGWVRFRRGDNDGALLHLERAYSMRSDPEIAAHLGEVLWTAGRKDEASKIWSDAAIAHPENAVLGETIRRLRGQ